jgi:hypothetical protein
LRQPNRYAVEQLQASEADYNLTAMIRHQDDAITGDSSYLPHIADMISRIFRPAVSPETDRRHTARSST